MDFEGLGRALEQSDFGWALWWGAAVSLLMAAIWVVRARVAGQRGFVMAGAFVVLAGLFVGLRLGWPGPLMGLGGVGLFVLLAADVAMRSAEREGGRKGGRAEKR